MNNLQFGMAVTFKDNVSGNIVQAQNNIRQFNKTVYDTSQTTKNFNRTIDKSVTHIHQAAEAAQSSSSKWGFLGKSIAATVTGVTTAALMRLPGKIMDSMGEATKAGAEFGDALARAGILLEDSGIDGNLNKIKESAMKLATTTKFSQKEILEGYQMLGQQGKGTTESIALMRTALNMATVGGTTTAQSIEFLSDAMSNYNVQAKDAALVGDLLTRGANVTKFSMNGLQMAFARSSPLAHTLGMEMTDLLALLGTMREAGIKEAQAGTAVDRMLGTIAKGRVDGKFGESLNRMGISLDSLKQKLKDPKALFEQLRPLLADPGVAEDLFGLKSGGSVLAGLTQVQAGTMDKIKAKLLDTSDTVAKKAAIVNNSLLAVTERFNNSLRNVAILWTDTIERTRTNFLLKMNNMVTNLMPVFRHVFTDISNFFQRLVDHFGGSDSPLKRIISDLTGAPDKSKAAIKQAIMYVITYYELAKDRLGEFVTGFSKGWDEVKGLFNTIADAIKVVFAQFTKFKIVRDTIDRLKEFFGFSDRASQMETLGKAVAYLGTALLVLGSGKMVLALASFLWSIAPIVAVVGALALGIGFLADTMKPGQFSNLLDDVIEHTRSIFSDEPTKIGVGSDAERRRLRDEAEKDASERDRGNLRRHGGFAGSPEALGLLRLEDIMKEGTPIGDRVKSAGITVNNVQTNHVNVDTPEGAAVVIDELKKQQEATAGAGTK